MKKKCSECKKEKDIEDFGKVSDNPDKKSYMCKDCVHEKARERERKKREENNNFLNMFL